MVTQQPDSLGSLFKSMQTMQIYIQITFHMAGNSMFKNEGKLLTVSSWLRLFVGGGVKQADQVRC